VDEEDVPQGPTTDHEARSAEPSDVPLFDRPRFRGGASTGGFPVTAPREVTPLDDDERSGSVPPAILWAMKDRRHEQLPHPFGHPSRLRAVVGAGDAAVYAIDDGSHHCMIGRLVGTTGDGCTYTLLGRVARRVYDQLAAGSLGGRQAFMEAKDAALVGTGEEPGLANVFDVDFYRHPQDIPGEYLPPSPTIDFTEDLPTSDR